MATLYASNASLCGTSLNAGRHVSVDGVKTMHRLRVAAQSSPASTAKIVEQEPEVRAEGALQRISVGVGRACAAAVVAAALTLAPVGPASARLEGVNRPELLPEGEFQKVIDTGGFLTAGQIKRLAEDISRLERDTGYKLRVLAQSYPNTPGLAVRDYWNVDDNTIVFVADPTFKNILNFNVGAAVDLQVPRSFWSRLAGKYGTIFYWREQGEEAAIEAAVAAIDVCLREDPGPQQCSKIL